MHDRTKQQALEEYHLYYSIMQQLIKTASGKKITTVISTGVCWELFCWDLTKQDFPSVDTDVNQPLITQEWLRLLCRTEVLSSSQVWCRTARFLGHPSESDVWHSAGGTALPAASTSSPSSLLAISGSLWLNLPVTSSVPACVVCLVASALWKAPELSLEAKLLRGVYFPRGFISAHNAVHIVLEICLKEKKKKVQLHVSWWKDWYHQSRHV